MKKKMIKWALCIWCGAAVMMTNNVMANCVDETGINDEIVGLTVAEPMPRIAIRIKEMLNQLPLLK